MIVDLKRTGSGGGRNAPKEEREPTQFWINVGYEANGKFVSLPLGIPLDSLPEIKVPGPQTKNPEFRQLQQARRMLHEQVKKLMETLEPGDEGLLPKLQVQIRRIEKNENVPMTEEEAAANPFALDISA